MRELKASQQKELSHIPIAELVSYSAKQNLEDDVCGDFDKVERCVRALIEGATTSFTPKHGIAQAGFTLQN